MRPVFKDNIFSNRQINRILSHSVKNAGTREKLKAEILHYGEIYLEHLRMPSLKNEMDLEKHRQSLKRLETAREKVKKDFKKLDKADQTKISEKVYFVFESRENLKDFGFWICMLSSFAIGLTVVAFLPEQRKDLTITQKEALDYVLHASIAIAVLLPSLIWKLFDIAKRNADELYLFVMSLYKSDDRE